MQEQKKTYKMQEQIIRQGNKQKKNSIKIAALEEKIKNEKENVIDCVEQGFYSMARTKLARIEGYTMDILELR